MRRVLLLGASGFIGRHVLAGLRDQPDLTTVTVTRRPIDRANTDQTRPEDANRTQFHFNLSSNGTALSGLLERAQPDVVVNCIGATSGGGEEMLTANVLVVSKLLEAMAQAVPTARLVHLGSAAEYGVIHPGRPVTEDAPCRPVSVYGITKLAATQLVTLARDEGRLEALTLRVFNPIGPGVAENTLPGRVALSLREAVRLGRREIKTGPLGSFRDFVDVRDVARAVVAAVTTPGSVRGPLNVGSGQAIRARALVDLFTRVVGFDGTVLEREAGSPRSNEVAWQQADLSRVGQALGWTPQFGLRDALESLWQSLPSPSLLAATARA